MLQISQQHLSAGATTAVKTHVLHRDIELRSRIALKIVGAQRYAADPSTEILCICYAADNDPIKLWRPGNATPQEFVVAGTKPKLDRYCF